MSKRMIQIALGVVFLAALLVTLLALIKPNSSFFYEKSRIQPQAISRLDAAYQYLFPINTNIFDPTTLLVLEDNKVLDLTALKYTERGGKGSFALETIGQSQITVVFVPTTPSDPASNGHTYQIFIRPYFITIDRAQGSLVVLLALAFAFWRLGLYYPGRRKALSEWSAVAASHGRVILQNIATAKSRFFVLPHISLLIQAGVNDILMAFLYIFMEWLFFVTMPSFMDMLSFGEKLQILLIGGLAAALLLLLTMPAMFLLDLILTPFFPSLRKYIFYLPSAFLATCLGLILLDNFTYSIFNYGVVETTTVIRALYALGFIGLFFYILQKMASATKAKLSRGAYRINLFTAVGLLAVSGILAGFAFQPQSSLPSQGGQANGSNGKPNIILLNTDGLNAANMSVYGYARNTTPFISELAKSSLLSENNFTNAYVSEGSETSTLTGKLPFATHVLNPPDILQGNAQEYQSLPRLLKVIGYRTVSQGVPFYVDVNTINFQDAFDAVNCKINSTVGALFANNYGKEIYILTDIEARITDRLKHIFFIQNMVNPYELVTQDDSQQFTDKQRFDCLYSDLALAAKTGQPLFAHVHLMGTHGRLFHPSNPVFSKGETQSQFWMTDFYDDSILNFDTKVQGLVQYLKDHNQWNNTILILYTDHGQDWVTKNRLPLIIHFPNDQHAGLLTANTQNIDIAPTLLAYLGMRKPDWMVGSSLLGKLDPTRLIIAAFKDQAENIISRETYKPPFYQFTYVSVVQCQNWYQFDLNDKVVIKGPVTGFVKPCAASILDSQEAIRAKIAQVLSQLGYTLPDW